MLSGKKLILISFLLVPISTSAGIFGPSSYEECILEKMEGVTSDVAANAIKRACRKQFPSSKSQRDVITLPKSELGKIKARGHITKGYPNGLRFTGKVYNGSDWHIRRVKISIKNEDTGESLSYDGILTSSVGTGFPISPNESGDIFISEIYEKPENYKWYLLEVEGYKR